MKSLEQSTSDFRTAASLRSARFQGATFGILLNEGTRQDGARSTQDTCAPRRFGHCCSLIFSISLVVVATCAFGNPVIIGSKKFTESYVLGEVAKRMLTDAGIPAEHRQGMGGTIILWQALRGGQIDTYAEYTGTIAQEILKGDHASSLEEIRTSLAKFGVEMTGPLGFNLCPGNATQ
jgi:hypothetical protein